MPGFFFFFWGGGGANFCRSGRKLSEGVQKVFGGEGYALSLPPPPPAPENLCMVRSAIKYVTEVRVIVSRIINVLNLCIVFLRS